MEILACKIRQNREIHGIQIFKREFKISQFADDTSLLCSSCESVKNAIQVLNNFGVVQALNNFGVVSSLRLVALVILMF